MPLPPPEPREHLHTRTVTCQGFLRQDGLWDIEGHIVDVKTYGFDNEWRGRVEAGAPVHEMWIRLSLDDRMEVKAVAAATDHSPFQICPDILPNFQRLVGARIGPGFTREVRARLGGPQGCTHIVEMLQQVATVAYQTMVAERAKKLRREQPSGDAEAKVVTSGGDSRPGDKPKRRPIVVDTCHAWRADGPLVQRYTPEFYTGDKSAAD
ncbi:MAG: DUF2889 domain-containing protein [Rhodospirillaceae bacterium]|nr:DUF2889 domain-containing protein [Rhodospirillaceae bacterium]